MLCMQETLKDWVRVAKSNQQRKRGKRGVIKSDRGERGKSEACRNRGGEREWRKWSVTSEGLTEVGQLLHLLKDSKKMLSYSAGNIPPIAVKSRGVFWNALHV